MTDPATSGAYRPPPEGWQDFGTHAPLSPVPPLTFSDETGEDGLPLWERHERCRCFAPTQNAPSCSAESSGGKEELAIHRVMWGDLRVRIPSDPHDLNDGQFQGEPFGKEAK